MKKVIVIDTSIYCVWLQVKGMETCGKTKDLWDYEKVSKKIETEINANSTLVLPLATIIETGNHISQSKGDRFLVAKQFSADLKNSVNSQHPWTAFSQQSELWNNESIIKLADNFPEYARQKISIGDTMIKDVAEFYAQANYQVEILTGDEGLKAYEPIKKPLTPRRRKK